MQRTVSARGLVVLTVVGLLVAGVGVAAVTAQTERSVSDPGPDNAPQTTIAGDLEVQGSVEIAPASGDATLRLSDPSGQTWEIQTDLDDFALLDLTGGAFPFFVADGAPTNALTVGPDGNVGVGVFGPADDVHVLDETPSIQLARLTPGSSGNTAWTIAVNAAGELEVMDDGNIPFRIEPVTTATEVSVGEGGVTVTAGSDPVGPGNSMFRLNRNGGPLAFQLEDDDAGLFWNISMSDGAGQMRFSRSGTGKREMVVDSSGNVFIQGDLFTQGASSESLSDRVAGLEAANTALAEQVAALTTRLERLEAAGDR